MQTLPALEAIKGLYPESRITWVVEDAAAGILEDHPLIDKLLVSRRKSWMRMLTRPGAMLEGAGRIIGFFRELRRERYDIAVDFQGLLKSGIVIGLSRADRKIGFDRTRELSYLFLNERLPAYDIEKHALERYLDVARYLGAKSPDTGCALPLGDEMALMEGKLRTIRREGSRVIVINPVARWKTKLWPEENFAVLADRLIREKNATVVLSGSREDRQVAGRISRLMQEHAFDWAGETSLKQLAALAKLSDLFITTDTGPMHLAAAAGAKVLALFGPTAPWRTGPYGSSQKVIRTGIDCSPCFRRRCEKNVQCMRGIGVSDVLNAIELK